ncbi:MAG: uridylate kinase [Anaerolineae bacterium]|nr:MAG: uridylate kinase [Anaerolineae bacterium]
MIFLKLGGSLITDKATPSTARPQVIRRLTTEVAAAWRAKPSLHLVLGHGSGSFGHTAASKYGTRHGVRTPEHWRGFAEVWHAASALNRMVVDAFQQAGLPAIAFPASAAAVTRNRHICTWDLTPLQQALEHGLLPVVYGDVVFDEVLGGSILSTEDIFAYLGQRLQPRRILIAGIEAGVWADYPACTRLIREITPASLPQITESLSGSAHTDVTGGMYAKVTEMLALLDTQPTLQEVCIFSGAEAGNVEAALLGSSPGTALHRNRKENTL